MHKVQKWGNSLAVRIPIAYAAQLNIRNGTEIEMVLKDNEISIRPVEKQFTLEELLAGVTPENRHHEISFGKPEGNEVW